MPYDDLAFPLVAEGGHPGAEGMYLRDYFAGKALVGILASEGNTETDANMAARRAYEMAEAMMAEREK